LHPKPERRNIIERRLPRLKPSISSTSLLVKLLAFLLLLAHSREQNTHKPLKPPTPISHPSAELMARSFYSFAKKKSSFITINMKNESEGSTAGGVFNSAEFLTFLSRDTSTSSKANSPFLSKESFINNLETSSVFKSKDSFSNLFASKDWEMKYTPPSKSASQPSSDDEEAPNKTFEVTTDMAQPSVAESLEEVPIAVTDATKSGDWIANETLGSHVEVALSMKMFSKESPPNSLGARDIGDHNLPPPTEASRADTHWEELFMEQLRPLAPAPPAGHLPALSEVAPNQVSAPTTAAQTASAPFQGSAGFVSFQAQATKARRKRAPRKKMVPENKEYVVEPTEHDIFCGRGGRSNHHPGNKRYRAEVDNLRDWYTSLDDKDEKTDLSQCLVDYVKSYGARFLERDETGWYVIDDITARRKVSQALREDTDPLKRHEKRQRFLAKKARCQQQATSRGWTSGA
jgi:hypothetical protein